MKLPLIYTDQSLKRVFENATAARNTRYRSAVNSASTELQFAVCRIQSATEQYISHSNLNAVDHC
jgi:hypothetical protein